MLVAPFDLEPAQHRLAAVLVFVITYWVTEAIPIPVTGILGLALAVMIDAAPRPEGDDTTADLVFGAFASDTIFRFIGSFIIAQAMMTHGLDRRVAFRVLSIPRVGRSTYRTIVAFGAIGALLSAFMSNTASTAMLFPIGLGIGTALMLMIAHGASVGGLLTPIGSPPNLIGREFIEEETGTTISFFKWVITAAPIVIPIAQSAGVDPVIPALAAVFGASYGFMLPVSAPPNPIVYGSGMIPITKMIRSGSVFNVAGVVLVTFGVWAMANVAGIV